MDETNSEIVQRAKDILDGAGIPSDDLFFGEDPKVTPVEGETGHWVTFDIWVPGKEAL